MTEATLSRRKMNALRLVRWLLVVPLTLVGWYVGLIAALLIHIAPNHRKRMAWIVYLSGLLYSVYLLVSIPGIWHAMASAAVAGGWVLWLFHRAASVDSNGIT